MPEPLGEERVESKRRGPFFWILVIVAVVLVWWYWRQPGPGNLTISQDMSDADPDDVIADFRDDVSDGRIAEIERALGIDLELVSTQSRDERMYRARVAPDRRDAIVEELSKLADVEVAEPDGIVQLIPQEAPPVGAPDAEWAGFPNDPQYKYQWHLKQIHMPDAWKLADGKDVIVAVIDTGVAYEDFKKFHLVPDLKGVKMTKGWNFVNDGPHANDDHGHGTHVAGTIAQATHNGVGVAGVARNATIMPLKVLSAGGSGSVAAIADAIRFAADNGAKVINMSLGGRFRSKVLERAVKYAYDKGVVVVCAAGNDGSGRVSFPAAYPGAFAVAATQYDEKTTFYSNWGKEIDIAAPGGNTRVDQNGDGMVDGVLQNTIVVGDPTRDGYFPFMGTSMAAPHVAGVAALVVGAGVTNPAAVEKILMETARAPKGGKVDKARYGAGIIDAAAAVKKARAETGGWQLGLAGLIGLAVVASTRRRIASVGAGFVGALVVGASGLFFLPYVSDTLSSAPVLSTLSRGFPSWDLSLLGASGHGNALFFSALVPLALVAVGYGVARFRGVLAGFALGVAGHLTFHLVSRLTDIRYVPNFLALDTIWLALNALILVAVSALVLRRDR